MLLHDSKVNGIPSGNPAVAQNHLLRSFKNMLIYGEHFVHDLQQCVERTLNLVLSIDSTVPMENLL